MIAAVGGDPLTVMVAYASSVAAALIGITVLSIKVYKYLQNKIIYYSKYLPKITAILIAFMAIGFACRGETTTRHHDVASEAPAAYVRLKDTKDF